MVDALIAGYRGPDHEHLNGHDEAPEVELATVSEGMVGVGRSGGSFDAIQDKEFVGRVDDRMNTLTQHRGAPGDCRRSEFHGRNREIAGERSING